MEGACRWRDSPILRQNQTRNRPPAAISDGNALLVCPGLIPGDEGLHGIGGGEVDHVTI